MRKVLVFLFTLIIVISLAGCKEEKVDKKTKNENTTNKSSEQVDSSKTQKEEEQAAPNNQQVTNNQEAEQGINLIEYRPEVGSKKSFTEKGQLIFTEEVIAANDEYVQMLLQLGDNKTTQIYRWTKDEITLIFEENNMKNPQKNILNEFEPIEKFETLLNNDSSKATTWKLLESDRTETVPAGNFNHVLVIQKVTNEVVNEETTYTRYYAPKHGLIKEEFKQSGENGYTATSELEKIE
ncbi:hypothetical protein AA0X95_06825 [Bacillus sp. 1P10SD]|uniref:hypothetical protein n=1 Tax=Bacillus sp. 1P10SD TaxID=3132265 RepID=UPI0039A61388